MIDKTDPHRPDRASPLIDWLTYLGSLHVSAIDLGLSRVRPVADALGITHINQKNTTGSADDTPYIFTVAGTNGKGSTTATIAKICELAGYKTALYQSPHVISFNERIKINSTMASDGALIDAFIQVDDARLHCGLSLSFFEMTTLAAMLIFKQANCDVWVLEVGLGGRLDVVNLIDPDVAVITNIGIDHVDWLGDDIQQIGREKSGILRHGIPCVLASDDMPDSVPAQAASLQCQVATYGTDYNWMPVEDDSWVYSSPALTLTLPAPSLALENVSSAITAIILSQLAVTQAHIRQAMLDVALIGRFHVIHSHEQTLVYDAAHNPHGVTFLLRKLLPLHEKLGHPEIHIVFSMLGDKDIALVIQQLAKALPQARWHIAPLQVKRAAPIAQLESAFIGQNQHVEPTIKYHTYHHLAEAMSSATLQADAHAIILVSGSFHTIAEAMLQQKNTIA